jgi:CMP-N,N'-diacetyllegionaminic acid synthase
MENVLGIIPARSGSKGIPNKNLRELAGKPLLVYTAEAARTAGVFDRIVLTTDSEEIAELGRSVGLEVPFLRPKELAKDDTPMLPVLQHAVRVLENEGWKPEIVVLLQPSSPLRKPNHIKDAVEILKREDCDSVVSVIEIPHVFAPQKALRTEGGFIRFWSEEAASITRRQQLETAYAREGTVYAVWRDVLMEKNSIYGDRCLPLVLPVEESLNLDTLDDWDRAEKKLKTLSAEAPR